MPNNRDFHRLYLAIGKFMVNWSMVEYELYRLAKMIYTNCKGELIRGKFPDEIADKIRLLEEALNKEPRLSGIKSDGLKLTKHIWRHRNLRHQVVHGSIAHLTNSSTETFVTFLLPNRIGKGPLQRAKRIQIKLSQIEKQAQEMEDRSMEFGYFLGQFESALPNPPGFHP